MARVPGSTLWNAKRADVSPLRCTRLIPAAVASLLLGVGGAGAYDPAEGDFARQSATDIRMLSWNVLDNLITDPSLTAGPITRILRRINPDIIALQEVNKDLSEAAIASALGTILGGSWTALRGITDGFNRNILASRYPFVQGTAIIDTVPASDLRGVTAALIDLPNAVYGTTDVYVMGVHMYPGGSLGPSGAHARRQRHADAIVNWMRDARNPGGNITLPAGTPMVVLGDTNLGFENSGDAAPYHASRTFLDGDIHHTSSYGADSPPDWDGTPLSDPAPYDHMTGREMTFPTVYSPGSRLDRFYYTDSVLRARGRFVFNTLTLSTAAMEAGDPALQANDTTLATDHLPVVVDFALGPEPALGRVLINEFSVDDAGADDRTFVELINVGGQEVNLQAPVDYQIVRCNGILPSSVPALPNQTGRLDLQGVIPPGGVFVLYDAVGETSGLRSVIEQMPRLQRQDHPDLVLINNQASGLALVVNAHYDVESTVDVAVDAYGYEDIAPFGRRFMRTASTVNTVIELTPRNLTPFEIISDAFSYARNPGFVDASSYAGWSIPGTVTPGLPNPPVVPLLGLTLR